MCLPRYSYLKVGIFYRTPCIYTNSRDTINIRGQNLELFIASLAFLEGTYVVFQSLNGLRAQETGSDY